MWPPESLEGEMAQGWSSQDPAPSPQGERGGNGLKGQRAPGGFLTIPPSPEHRREAPCDRMEAVWRRLAVSVSGCCAFHVVTRQRCDVGFSTTLFYG